MRPLIFGLLTFLFGPSASQAQVLTQDSLALVDLYNATDGENWTHHANWLEGPVSTWYGVTLSNDRVYILNLYDNNLNGSIPPSIGQLDAMVEINLRKSKLTGTIPEEIGQLSNLYQLDLAECGLSGTIPASLSQCTGLGRINLYKNNLSGNLPASLAQCTGLIHLLINDNQLTGPFPAVIESWPALEQLNLSGNLFSGTIPSWISSLNQLYWLFLENIPFEGEMPFLGNKPNLTQFVFGPNSVTGDLEVVLGQYPELAYGIIYGTQLTGNLSTQHFNPGKMVRLEVYDNQLQSLGDFSGWPAFPNFISLVVFNNQLDFDDMLPNSSMPSNQFIYTPQKPIGKDTVITLVPGASYTIASPMQNEDIQYNWFFNHQLITGATGPEFSIEPFSSELAGTYFFTATHAAFPAMTLSSATTTLEEETTSTEAADKSCLRIYPNPTQDDIVIVSDPASALYQIQLYSVEGHLLYTGDIQDHESRLSLKDYPSGMYILKSMGLYGNSLNRIIKW